MNATTASPRRPRKRWLLLWVLLGAIAGGVIFYFTPRVYQASTSLLILPQRIPEEFVRATTRVELAERLNAISQRIFSRTRLERVITEFNLYSRERSELIMEDVVEQMRRDIGLTVTASRNENQAGSFSVSFLASEPRTAQRVSERLASMFVQENLEDRALQADQVLQFLRTATDDLRKRLTDSERQLSAAKRQGVPTAALAADHQVLQDTYRTLDARLEEATLAVNMERRQLGEQFRIIDAARLPEKPAGRGLPWYLSWGAIGGLVVGLVARVLTGAFRRRRAARLMIESAAAA